MKGKDPETGYDYCRCMILFQRATGKDPDQFLAWARTVDPVEVQDLVDQVAETIRFTGARFNFKIELRSFLRTNGYNNLPKGNLTYTLQEWHRGYSKEETRKLLGFLDDKIQKLYVYLCAETGFRAQTVLDIRYKHIRQDFEQAPPLRSVAIRLGPEFFSKKKAAGYWYLGRTTVDLVRDLIKEGRIEAKDEAPLVDKQYMTIWKVLNKARDKAGIDKKIQLSHGFRKYFENALDQVRPAMDENRKRVYEGHFSGTRGKHYSARGWDDEDARADFLRAYPFVSVDSGNPELEATVQQIQVSGTDKEQELERKIEQLEARGQRIETLLESLGKAAGLPRDKFIDALIWLEEKYTKEGKQIPKEALGEEEKAKKKRKP